MSENAFDDDSGSIGEAHHFTKTEIARLWKRFHALSCRTTRGSVAIPIAAILALPELVGHNFARHVIRIFCFKMAAEDASARAAEAAAAATGAEMDALMNPVALEGPSPGEPLRESAEVLVEVEGAGTLGLKFGVDPETAAVIVVEIQDGVVEQINPGMVESGDVLRAIAGRKVLTFGEIDADGDMSITREEAGAALGALRDAPPSEDEVDELWLQCDEDGDGTVSFGEFRAKLAELLLDEAVAHLGREARPFTIAFARAAEDSSESSSSEEWEHGSSEDELDAEAEGEGGGAALAEYPGPTVRFRTFVAALSVLSLRANVEEKVKVMFDACDGDGDGAVSAVDFLRFMRAIAAPCASTATLALQSSAIVRALQPSRWSLGAKSGNAKDGEKAPLLDGAFRGGAGARLVVADFLSNEPLAAELAARLCVDWQ